MASSTAPCLVNVLECGFFLQHAENESKIYAIILGVGPDSQNLHMVF